MKSKSTTRASACRHMWSNANVVSQQKYDLIPLLFCLTSSALLTVLFDYPVRQTFFTCLFPVPFPTSLAVQTSHYSFLTKVTSLINCTNSRTNTFFMTSCFSLIYLGAVLLAAILASNNQNRAGQRSYMDHFLKRVQENTSLFSGRLSGAASNGFSAARGGWSQILRGVVYDQLGPNPFTISHPRSFSSCICVACVSSR